ncbi:GNAT family N-acetyltransferase [Tateyamaria pelophila]|uniref:GNAT family N-acetyltransferase n=1 Tax=Tateyamaria pelophila TaxID=328415 RepID=UPI001CC12AD2|nr:GNAT family N-acetyltransferase [Tateyamaria pelophila]
MSRHVPTINTSRTTLRAMRPCDFDRFAEIWTDEAVVRYIGGEPRSRDTSWKVFLQIAGHWQVTGFGQWAIEAHETGTIVGQTGFFLGARGLGDDFDSVPEAGWVLAPEAQGRGLAAEAVCAAHDWFDRVITGPLVCMIDPDNETSLKLAEQLGYTGMRTAEYGGGTVHLMSRRTPPLI